MPIYTLASKEILEHIKQYTKRGEVVKISDALEYNNILYREILSKFKEYNFDMNKINYITYQKNIIFNPIIVG